MRNTQSTVPFLLRGLLCLAFLCLGSFGAEAQQLSKSRRANQQYQSAMQALGMSQWNQAAEYLNQALKADQNFPEAHQALGDIYRRNKQYSKAAHHYQQVIRIRPDLTSMTWFGLGESLFLSGHYQAALEALEEFGRKTTDTSPQRKLSSKYIADCLYSLDYFKKNPKPEQDKQQLINLGAGINSPDDEYFPKLTADGRQMIFTRKVNQQESFYESWLNSIENTVQSRQAAPTTTSPQTHWSESKLLEGEINTQHFNEGAHCISPDGKYLYFTGCNRPGGMGSCDLYVSRRKGQTWATPRNLGPKINTSGWEAQPALSADGRSLFFVSNRPGGMGGYDIWKSDLLENGDWGPAENLGPSINTDFDESSPFIHADNQTLYFTSNGWPGFGDKDIFRSSLDSLGQWQQPVNMGYPINDHSEQSSWSVSMNGADGFFSSRTEGGKGGLDIYRIPLAENQRPAHVAYLKGGVVDAESGKPIARASVRITELNQSRPSFTGFTDQDDGYFLAPLVFGNQYALHIDHPDYLFHSGNYSLQDAVARRDGFEITIALNQIKVGQTEILQNIFFATAEYNLLPESYTELNKLFEFLQSNPRIKVEISGHTDNTGNESTNQLLSERRAGVVREFLINRGIPAQRIESRGYGQHQPIASNQTEEGRQQNRRTEFSIIGN